MTKHYQGPYDVTGKRGVKRSLWRQTLALTWRQLTMAGAAKRAWGVLPQSLFLSLKLVHPGAQLRALCPLLPPLISPHLVLLLVLIFFNKKAGVLYLKWITNKDLPCGPWNSAQCYVAAWMGGEFGVEWIHVYVRLSPFAVHLKLTTLLIGHTSIQNKKFKIIKKKAVAFPKMGLLTDLLMPGMKAVLRCCLLSKVGFWYSEPQSWHCSARVN